MSTQLRLADAERDALEHAPRRRRNDFSGLVMTLLATAGVDAVGDTRSFWAEAKAEGRAYIDAPPSPGDLVFFDRTWDANKNGRVDDDPSHIAIVADVLPDGTLLLVHKSSKGVGPLRVNLEEPDVAERDRRVLNDPLRSPRYGPKNGPRLSGELVRGFAKPPQPPADDGEAGLPLS